MASFKKYVIILALFYFLEKFMHLLHDIHHGDIQTPNCIVEIPQGSFNKYEVHKNYGILTLDRVSYGPSAYPFNYGYIPQTHWDDDDALDVVIPSTFPIDPGILLAVRPVALMRMTDDGEEDSNVIAVPADDRRWEHVQDLADLNPHMIKEWKVFFETYKSLKGKPARVEVGEILGRDEAIAALERGVKMYKEKYGRVGESEIWEGQN